MFTIVSLQGTRTLLHLQLILDGEEDQMVMGFPFLVLRRSGLIIAPLVTALMAWLMLLWGPLGLLLVIAIFLTMMKLCFWAMMTGTFISMSTFSIPLIKKKM